MSRERLEDVVRELFAESIRTATLVGLGSIPIGIVWVLLWGTGSGAVVVIAGALVGVLYSDRSTPAYRAGARAGLFVPLPEAVAQVSLATSDVWASSASTELKIAGSALFGISAFLTVWVFLTVLCIVVAAVVGVVVDHTRSYLFGSANPGS